MRQHMRIGLAPVLGYLIIEEDFHIAPQVFALAGLTDLSDGFIAQNWANRKSVLGNLTPVPLTYMISSRDVMLIAAGFYVRYRTPPTLQTLSKCSNPCSATARLKPTLISKTLWTFTAFTTAAPAYSYYHYGRKTVRVIKG
ncbi:hypothetical protein HPG69_012499, partial [Diceros bicornis minor]